MKDPLRRTDEIPGSVPPGKNSEDRFPIFLFVHAINVDTYTYTSVRGPVDVERC